MDYDKLNHTAFKGNLLVEKSLDLKLREKKANYYLKWGVINLLLLLVLMSVYSQSSCVQSNFLKLEYGAIIIIGLNTIACFTKYLFYMFKREFLHGTVQQKNLLKFDENDSSFVIFDPIKKKEVQAEDTLQNTDINTSWHSSFIGNRSLDSTNWNYTRTPLRKSLSPQQQQKQVRNESCSRRTHSSPLNVSALNNESFVSPYQHFSRVNQINDEGSLQQYLNDVLRKENSVSETHDVSHNFNSNSINSFWNYCNLAANVLKTSIYQLAPTTSSANQNKQVSKEDIGLNIVDKNSEIIKRISSEKLSRYVGNLRTWISATILQRLANEIQKVDESFKHRGLLDMQIGSIGLERLKKTVENKQFVTLHMPMLPLIVPFLEMSSNQEYLVQRIKDLAKGSCITDYRWDSGSEYHGLKWDEHLPTDAAIIFHLFCVYLDTQLMPLPQNEGRPFYSRYVVVGEEKRSGKDTVALVQNRSRCAILCTNPLKPKFNFISEGEIHACAYDRNNLFYVIIQFLVYMRSHQESCLEGVNLGASGINLMCAIDD
uniref:Transmembrane protein 209 n=1 Tax=Glossina palpalis gambiensis TaxID=67801 RepID=A0A1B0BL71_9MUSC